MCLIIWDLTMHPVEQNDQCKNCLKIKLREWTGLILYDVQIGLLPNILLFVDYTGQKTQKFPLCMENYALSSYLPTISFFQYSSQLFVFAITKDNKSLSIVHFIPEKRLVNCVRVQEARILSLSMIHWFNGDCIFFVCFILFTQLTKKFAEHCVLINLCLSPTNMTFPFLKNNAVCFQTHT